ncbi:hypothetical protein [Paraburkholderia hospita]|uniref:hypothetical protein n=1 Tax=Paraburkholderia TaxID=1822464 RepID=UPI0002716963|nr:hypothetical protein [Paraburkholderia hospita]EUC15593.1 hypothetical protein PMI06_005495 [Burkholderia sp. BT03]SKC84710.1 hypothetical protein SAMN05445504_4172 [Burkholderia sp. CF099]SOE85923.1 hypothetical protein SAMN05446935_6407 [Burkholderia sp. YR290]OUL93663.1 hypothetical protein CA603_12500 [Paraburkholderia hospita]OUL95825.1 hypothetical protein CA601_04105 [Paraburkholderia hospita]
MDHFLVALVVFVCVFGSAVLGAYLRAVLPEHHLSDESAGFVQLATSLIATMAALVPMPARPLVLCRTGPSYP